MLSIFKRTKRAEFKEINWHTSRYSVAIAQRNVLLVLALLLLVILAIGIFVLFKISTSKTIEPFIIEIDKKTGVVHVVNPVTLKEYAADKALSNHFVTEYIKTREVFIDPYNYDNYSDYALKIRLFSSYQVYDEFIHSIVLKGRNLDDVNLYSPDYNRSFSLLSISIPQEFLGHPNTLQVKFAVQYKRKDGSIIKKNKIAVVSYEYGLLKLDERQVNINPLGFRVVSYRVDNEYT